MAYSCRLVLPAINPNTVALHGDTKEDTGAISRRKLFFPKRNDIRSAFTSKSLDPSFLSPTVSDNASMTRSSPPPAGLLLPSRWREVQGSRNWENLVEPLDPILRQEIIRYGELVNACYKAFDLDPTSKRYLNCKFGKKNMLKQVGLEYSGYQVTKYIYATPEINIPTPIQKIGGGSRGRWIGYVALSTDETVKKLGRRDILISFRGTVTNPEWVANFMSSLTQARLDPHHPRPDVKVESGFLSLYTSEETHKFGLDSCRQQLLSEVARLVNELKSKSLYCNEDLSITLAGHSMGSSLALILAYDIAELGLNRSTPVTVFSFAGPRVGNSGFKERCEELGVKVLRIVNVNDPITKLPGVVFNEKFRVLGSSLYELPWSYAHVGVELALDFFDMQNPSCVHDLETYINLLKHPAGACCGKMKREYSLVGLESISCWARELISKTQNFGDVLNVVNLLVQSQRT